MSIYRALQKVQQQNNSMICLGLDLDVKRMPSDYAGSLKQMFEFAHRMIDATADLVCAYKPNMAFYEHHGPEGLSLLKLIRDRIPDHIPVILDGKRNDIGNTASHYARALFETFRADWVTLNPYMGYDSMRPFLEYKDKGIFVLCLTSNAGSKDFQELIVNGKPLYLEVAEKVSYWNKDQNCGLVVGATHPEQLRDVRNAAGDMPLLIPGVGAQGGSLEEAAMAGTDGFQKPAVINVSRSVLYASNDADFAQRARQELERLNGIIKQLRNSQRRPSDGQASEQPPEQMPAQPPQNESPSGNQNQENRPQPDHRAESDSQEQGPSHGERQESRPYVPQDVRQETRPDSQPVNRENQQSEGGVQPSQHVQQPDGTQHDPQVDRQSDRPSNDQQ